jgi:predicted Zn-dependent protease
VFGPRTAFADQLPDIGEVAGAIMTPAEEKRLGQAFMRSVRSSTKVIDDPLFTDYMSDLGKKLAQHTPTTGLGFSLFLIDDPRINAFAGPAGHIGVFSGLVMTAETESELAAVVAHEISHVTQNHLRRTWQAASKLGVSQAAIRLGAVILGAALGSDAGIAAATLGQAGLAQQQLNFSRANEQEADRVGISLLAEAGYDPRAMPSFFQRLGRASRTQSSTLPEYLRTHPVTTSRISDSLNRADTFPYRQRTDDVRFHLLRAALREREHFDPKQAVLLFRRTLEDGRYRNETAERYGYVLALMRSKRLTDARRELNKLLPTNPGIKELVIVDARLHEQTGETERAIATLRRALLIHPGNAALTQTLAEILLRSEKAQAAYLLLKAGMSAPQAGIWRYALLARAASSSGRPAEGHEYLAEYHYALGQLAPAVLQLEIALRDYDLDFYDSSRLEARLRGIKAELNDLKSRPDPRL